MSAEYDFYKNPIPAGSNRKPRLHARIVTRGTTDTEKLAEDVHSRCSLSTADVMAALVSLSEIIVERLQEGERIHIKGLGYFQMTVKCPPVKTEKEIRAESIRFKSVAFRPEAELKKELNNTQFVRARYKSHSSKYSEIEVDGLLTGYFLKHDYILRVEFQRLCGFTKGTANRRLAELIKAGKLKKEGLYRFPIYVPVQGYYLK